MAYRLLVGKPYWAAMSVAAIAAQVLYDPMVAPSTPGSTLAPRFDSWFFRACSRDPGQRFGNAREQIESLAAAVDAPLLPANEPTPAPGTTDPGNRFASGSYGGASGSGPRQRPSGPVDLTLNEAVVGE